MKETLHYQYKAPSSITRTGGQEHLFLSKFNEVQKSDAPCFFWGRLKSPYEISRCLITLSNIVQSSFNLSPFQLALLKDPIVTAGNNQIRFEGFSHCAGVYARVDVLEEGHDGEFLENGTTNVDFNTPLISALSKVRKSDNLVLSVGKKEVGFHKEGEHFIERKVPLPLKWIKGLTTVQQYLSESDYALSLNRLQAVQLFKTIPATKVKTDYYLIKRGNKFIFSPVSIPQAPVIGGIHRLKLLQPLLPLIKEMKIFPHKDMQSISFILCFDTLNFVFSVSRDFWRGFSGEGAGLESLLEEVPANVIQAFDNYSYSNQVFRPALLSLVEDLDLHQVEHLAAKLAAMGLLGYDLLNKHYFYRSLPFKMNRILSLNPRLKGAEKLLEENKVHILIHEGDRIEAKVEGTAVQHYVLVDKDIQKCTCTWYSRHQGERGMCKHILAVKKKAKCI